VKRKKKTNLQNQQKQQLAHQQRRKQPLKVNQVLLEVLESQTVLKKFLMEMQNFKYITFEK